MTLAERPPWVMGPIMCERRPRRWTIKPVAAFFAGGLVAVGLSGCATTGRPAAAAEPPVTKSLAEVVATEASPTLGPLSAAQKALAKAITTLQRPAAENGNVIAMGDDDRDRALATARDTLAAGLDYVRGHPAEPAPSADADRLEATGIRPAALPYFIDRNPAGRLTNPGLVEAMDALNAALGEMTNGHPEEVPASRMEAWDGTGEKIIYGLALTDEEISAGLKSSYVHWLHQEQQATGVAVPD